MISQIKSNSIVILCTPLVILIPKEYIFWLKCTDAETIRLNVMLVRIKVVADIVMFLMSATAIIQLFKTFYKKIIKTNKIITN